MSEFKHYPWSTDYKKIWEYIQNKIESEHNEHPFGTQGLGLIFVYNDKILSDISWLYSPYEPFDSKPLSLFIGFDPVCESLCDISEYEEFEAWAKNIDLRFLDPEKINTRPIEDALRAENKRLRRALEAIAVFGGSFNEEVARDFYLIAEEALKDGE